MNVFYHSFRVSSKAGMGQIVPTLLMFDVVDLDSGCNEELRAEIERDGVILYERRLKAKGSVEQYPDYDDWDDDDY